jgi:hypothetical protein
VQNTSTIKQDIIDWLEQKIIRFSKTETRTEFLKCVHPFRHNRKMYELDQLTDKRGHQVVQLPPYHCHYNIIEVVWSQVNLEVAKKNKTFTVAEVERLVNIELDRVVQEDWASCVR